MFRTRSNFWTLNMQWWLWVDFRWDSWKYFAAQLSWSSDGKDCKLKEFCTIYLLFFLFFHFFTLLLLSSKVKCLEMLGVSDLRNQYIMRTQQMVLNGENFSVSINFLLVFNALHNLSCLNYLSLLLSIFV